MDILNDKSGLTILFSSLPKRDAMCFIVGYINNTEKRQSSAKSKYHWQIFRCRQLIFSEPEILASPTTGFESAIYIVMTDEFYKTGKLQFLLEKLNITSNSPEPVSNQIYETCFRYTLVARICPLWNQVDNCLIQGRNFLTNASLMDAIKFEMIIRNEELYLSVIPLRVKLPLLKSEHLDESPVHLLPSMRKGHVKSVTYEIPGTCPYGSYKDLKRHWKNMYGYRLPEDSDQLFYCCVTFNGNSYNPYTYPNLCVRKNGLVFLRNKDHLGILQKFVSDIASKLPTVCGKPFGVDSKILYAVPKLCSWRESLGQANLSNTPMNKLPVNHFKYVPTLTKMDSTPSYNEVTSSVQQNVPLTANNHSSVISYNEDNGGLILRKKSGSRGMVKLGNTSFAYAPGIKYYVNRVTVKKESLQKQEKKLVPVFKSQACPVTTQPISLMGEMNGRPISTHAFNTFQHVAYLNPATPLYPKEAGKKKPRSRPQVQPDINVEDFAKRQDLARVNTATLVNWLRSNQVPCKVKDRKSDLVEKVMTHLNLPH